VVPFSLPKKEKVVVAVAVVVACMVVAVVVECLHLKNHQCLHPLRMVDQDLHQRKHHLMEMEDLLLLPEEIADHLLLLKVVLLLHLETMVAVVHPHLPLLCNVIMDLPVLHQVEREEVHHPHLHQDKDRDLHLQITDHLIMVVLQIEWKQKEGGNFTR